MQKDKYISGIIIYSPVLFIAISMLVISFFVHLGFFPILIFSVLMLGVYFVAKKIAKSIEIFKQELQENEQELEMKNEELLQRLYVDTLTQLPNEKAMLQEIKKMQSPKVVIFDIDSFRNINEYYGKDIGDFILLEVRDSLLEFIQKSNMKLFRVGADEFAFLEDKNLDIEEYEEILPTLVQKFKSREIFIPQKNESVAIHITIGSSLESEDVLAKAYMALYHAKETQKDYAFYIQTLDTKELYAKQVKWANLIKKAIEKDEVVPYFQPIFNDKGEVTKYECLARIMSEDKAISPGMFLETSKNVRQYPKMAKVLIEKAFQRISHSDKSVSINLLARDMSDSDVSNYVLDKVKEYDVAKQVVLEILEDENIQELERVTIFLNRMRRMGVRVAIDDFGTGYSNFSYLLKLKPDYIKIDGSLIKNIDSDANSVAIVSAILTFSKKMGIKTIAEYIHSKEVYDKCKELGIDEFQGFYLGEPSSTLS
jgi:diguanylate cyclase (GGDEF)-like protein